MTNAEQKHNRWWLTPMNQSDSGGNESTMHSPFLALALSPSSNAMTTTQICQGFQGRTKREKSGIGRTHAG
ncbi:uncharacterized protein G2W53_001358 [Senna tora]|uniref:Uncharacterized protein n=1 Tax=Senna tora TaxID=362788 RepID=A0A834XJK0_9FABA|nr:uncharacterized protein G2W53_001358 [Senna tora]